MIAFFRMHNFNSLLLISNLEKNWILTLKLFYYYDFILIFSYCIKSSVIFAINIKLNLINPIIYQMNT